MKIFTILIFSFLLFGCNQEQKDNAENQADSVALSTDNKEFIKRYPCKSGIIEYQLSGASVGTLIIYFDDWGMKEVQYEKSISKMMDVETELNTAQFYLYDSWFTVDFVTKRAQKKRNKLFDELKGKSSFDEILKHKENQIVEAGGKKNGQEKIIDRLCDIWQINSDKTWLWKGIPLKTESDIMGIQTISKAVRVIENAEIDSAKFSVPKDVEIL